jgi:hypothetical protein
MHGAHPRQPTKEHTQGYKARQTSSQHRRSQKRRIDRSINSADSISTYVHLYWSVSELLVNPRSLQAGTRTHAHNYRPAPAQDSCVHIRCDLKCWAGSWPYLQKGRQHDKRSYVRMFHVCVRTYIRYQPYHVLTVYQFSVGRQVVFQTCILAAFCRSICHHAWFPSDSYYLPLVWMF